MRTLNKHLTQTREYQYGHSAEDTIDEALFQLDLAISQLDKIRDSYARETAKTQSFKHVENDSPSASSDFDPMATVISRNIPALVRKHMQANR